MDDRTMPESMWKGGNQPSSFPHRCPYRKDGADKDACITLSGQSFRQNAVACCGAMRGQVKFEPCNSQARRCIKCLEAGKLGLKANAVTDVKSGLCDEHKTNASSVPKATPARADALMGKKFEPPHGASKKIEESAGPLLGKKATRPLDPLLSGKAPEIQASPVPVEMLDQGAGKPLKIPLSRLRRYQGQPRRYFNNTEIAELADDIQQNGQETPNRVFPTPDIPGDFTLIGGERRWRAYQLIARRTRTDPLVDCVLSDVADARDHFRKAFRDNIKRKDYIPRDEADAYKQMYDDSHLRTHEEKVLELMRDAGKPRKHIENYLLVASLPQEAKDLMNPDLLEKQLVYLIALEIARSTTDADTRIKLAKETSQKCMGLSEARFYIRKQTGHSSYGGSGRSRKPADEYNAYKSTLAGLQTRVNRIQENWDIEGIYEARPKSSDDRKKDAVFIKTIITALEKMLSMVEGNIAKNT